MVEDLCFDLGVEFVAPFYGQLLNGSFLIFKPVVVPMQDELPFIGASRIHPIIFSPIEYADVVRIRLPPGLKWTASRIDGSGRIFRSLLGDLSLGGDGVGVRTSAYVESCDGSSRRTRPRSILPQSCRGGRGQTGRVGEA